MSFSRVYSAQAPSLEATIVRVETDISNGLHAYSIVGLPTKAVEEAQDRIAAAVKNTGFTSPKQRNQKVVVSLAPASLKKEGTAFDLAIALGYLKATRAISFNADTVLFLGELSLDGSLKPIRGVLPIAKAAAEAGFEQIIVPRSNAKEAAFVRTIEVYGAETLFEVITHINTQSDVEFNPPKSIAREPITTLTTYEQDHAVDCADIRGQEAAKRALEIAASGGHNIAFHGPPGAGKTLLARALVSILPPLDEEASFETTAIHSIAGTLPPNELVVTPPFRSPHHTSSPAAVIGGGNTPRPGELTLAHNGVLFLDEFPEFDRRIMESLREPLEERVVVISRSQGSVRFPADFILAVALNPCPCGYFESETSCTCTAHDIHRYQKKLSGPLIDRIDLWSTVEAVPYTELAKRGGGEKSVDIRARVHAAREKQKERQKKNGAYLNNALGTRELEERCLLKKEAESILIRSAQKMNLSARTYHRSIKIARTIADLEGSKSVEEHHILEALQYRPAKGIGS